MISLRINILFCIIILFVFSFVHTVVSQENSEPINPDRPDQTESPEVIVPGIFQMESGFIFEKTLDFHGNTSDYYENNTSIPQTVIRIGLLQDLEFRTYLEYRTRYSYFNNILGDEISDVTQSGFLPVRFGVKIKVSEGEKLIPTVGFLIKLSFPKLAGEDFKNDYLAPELILSLEHNPAKNLTIGYNIGMVWDGETPEQTDYITISVNYSISKKFAVYIEPYGYYKYKTAADNRLDGGLTFLISNNVMVDAEGGFGLSSISPKYFYGAGFSFRLPKI